MGRLLAVGPRRHALDVAVVAGGGYLGANGRYGISLLVPGTLEATLLVNVLGSFLLGALVYRRVVVGALSSRLRLLFGTGFLSSFTTYSTFVLDATSHPESAVPYVLASYALGFGAVLLARWILRRPATPGRGRNDGGDRE
ncbi:CrcB protein [Halalkaliarchaeum desulfuricum]|uniref:Fluoride-specific ion channel FluC n=1 Tax=Halalkaliarchaeum desulfuricum TaxID=2055893 RepID=A0A343THF5_9EURY|nr:CrcB family protein [Halalkaliarchaeum desulfuricum]AUX08527.1 CrcB protein [Halalkaliarchaeum desulfuricum]